MKITPERLIDLYREGPIKELYLAVRELAEKTDGATDDNPAHIGHYIVNGKHDFTSDISMTALMLGFVLEEVSALRKDVRALLKRGREKRQ